MIFYYVAIRIYMCVYVYVITWARGICLIYTHDTQGRTAPEGKCVRIYHVNPECTCYNLYIL